MVSLLRWKSREGEEMGKGGRGVNERKRGVKGRGKKKGEKVERWTHYASFQFEP